MSAHKRCFVYITYILGRVFCLEISCFMLYGSKEYLLNSKKLSIGLPKTYTSEETQQRRVINLYGGLYIKTKFVVGHFYKNI